MASFNRWDRGDWEAICDSCGRKFKASKLKQRWDGLMVCQQDWEPRQPQDFVRGVPDPQLVPWVRDEATDAFVPIAYSAWWLPNLLTTSYVSLVALFIQGPEVQTTTSVVSATLSFFRRLIITAGARQVDGSSINTNSLG